MEKFRTIIFDFDGTLAELSLDFAAMRKRIAALAEAFLEREIAANSMPVLEWVDELAQCFGQYSSQTQKEFKTRCRLLITAMEMDAAEKGKLFDYTLPLLNFLKERGIRTAIITRNCTAAVMRVFPSINEHCQVLLARDAVQYPKPHPQHIWSAIQRLGASAGNCLMVGDHPLDIETAARAGIKSAAVASGRCGLQQLKETGPDFLAQDVQELREQLLSRNLL